MLILIFILMLILVSILIFILIDSDIDIYMDIIPSMESVPRAYGLLLPNPLDFATVAQALGFCKDCFD